MIELLRRIGLVRIDPITGYARWPFYIWPKDHWKVFMWPAVGERDLFGVFRNRPNVIKWEKGRLLPRRWGVRIWGLEIGDRG